MTRLFPDVRRDDYAEVGPVNDQEKLVQYLKMATVELYETKQRLRELESQAREPIAVVGMGCRFPGGVRSAGDLWDVVAAGREVIGEFPVDRGWDLDGLFSSDPDESGTTYVRRGGFLEDAGGFDAEFFGISPREALGMDPQQRVMLEVAWEAVERAGIDPRSLAGTPTGVFAGMWSHEYGAGGSEAVEGHRLTGVAASVASGRISYLLGLEGPAITVDTACSSSLVAVHQACQSLRSGECDLALAGGVTVMASTDLLVDFARQRALAADGRTKAFGAGADGMVVSEGAGIVLLEKLSDARANKHPILAVIRGSAINQDGASNGLTAPHGPSQQRVIRAALANAGLTAADVDVVEAHGTGTALGDPIEAGALLATYGQERPADRPLWLGSVKSNIGHTQAAAGIAGVIKMVAAMERGVLPRSLHVDEPSPHVDWSGGAVSLLAESRPWHPYGRLRRAGVSSFGISGTNAHLILEEPPVVDGDGDRDGADADADADADAGAGGVSAGSPLVVWPLSGRSEEALRAQAGRLGGYLAGRRDVDAVAVAHGLAAGRTHFAHRAVIVGPAVGESDVGGGLGAVAGGWSHPGVVCGRVSSQGPGRTVLVFPGQGSQQAGMGLQLYEAFGVFRGALDECDEALRSYTGWSVVEVLRGEAGVPGMRGAGVVQPVLFAVMVSLARLWRSWGIVPDAVVGHSQGEIAAAHVAGALSLQDAAVVVALRSRALAGLAGSGAMASVWADAVTVSGWLGRWEGRLWVATVNGPQSTTVSGTTEAVQEFLAVCAAEGVRAQAVDVDYASHSPLVEGLRETILQALAGIDPQSAEVPFFSTVEGEAAGRPLDTTGLDAGYWYRNLRNSVRFDETVACLLDQDHRVFVEVSPHPILVPAFQARIEAHDLPAVAVGSLRKDRPEATALATALATLHVHGLSPDWNALYPAPPITSRPELPTYPFQHQRYWLTPTVGAGGSVSAAGLEVSDHPLVGAVTQLAEQGQVVLTGRLSLREHPWLADHTLTGRTLLPATAFVDLVLQAADHAGHHIIDELVLQTPLPLNADTPVDLQLVVEPPQNNRCAFSVHSRPHRTDRDEQNTWTLHASGYLSPDSDALPDSGASPHSAASPATADWDSWPPPGAHTVQVESLYERLAARGYHYGPAFQALSAIWRQGENLYAEIQLPENLDPRGHTIHPALLDAALHPLLLTTTTDTHSDSVRMPFALSGITLHATHATKLRVHITIISPDTIRLIATDPADAPVISVDTLTLRSSSPLSEGHAPSRSRSRRTGTVRRRAGNADTAHSFAAGLTGLTPGQQHDRVLRIVQAHVATVLGHVSSSTLDPGQPFKALGFTSLNALELRKQLGQTTGCHLPPTVVFDHPTPRALATHLYEQVAGVASAAVPTPVGLETDEPIAVVGIGCRFPGGVRSAGDLWDVVVAGREVIGEFPVDRGWDLDGLFSSDPDESGTTYVRRGGFLEDAAGFDAEFFGISPREALGMDPQQRVLLEVAWEAVERAGIDPRSLAGTPTGVFAGMWSHEYGAGGSEAVEGHRLTGVAASVASGRISYLLGLEGPAITVDTACSSSLVAIHLAAQALRRGECSLALAGAVTVMASTGLFVDFARQRVLAADGRTKAFGAGADGMVASEGAGMLLLERVSDARRLGHRVLAVIRGSAINQDGASNGLTAPHGPSQQRVIRAALANAGLAAADVDVVEAHGTGTALGDPIEAQAIIATYGQERPADRPLWLGSVKSNIGHTQAAAGIAGVIKMVAAMERGVLPRSLHVDEPSPHVDWSGGAVSLLAESRPWHPYGRLRRAGVSSFGISGTNAHLILEEPPAVGDQSSGDGGGSALVVWPLSGRSEEALRAQAGRLGGYLAGRRDVDAVAVAHGLAAGRTHFAHRAVIVGPAVGESDVGGGLGAVAGGWSHPGVVCGRVSSQGPGRTVLVFPGQGSQQAGMGLQLYEAFGVFRGALDECDEALRSYTGWSVVEVLRGEVGVPGMRGAGVVQPVLFAVMVSLARLWRSWGIVPDAVVGHSQGEIAAAHVAGALSLQDAAVVVALRSRSLAGLAGSGAMASVWADAVTVAGWLGRWEGRLWVATVNGPQSTTVSGTTEAVKEFLAVCAAEGVRAQAVDVDYASHSPLVEGLRETILEALAGIRPQSAEVPFFSTVEGEAAGRPLDTTGLDAGYWYRNLRNSVRFDETVACLLDQDHRVFVEVSPHPILVPAFQARIEAHDLPAVAVGSLRKDRPEATALATALATLHVHGLSPDWNALYPAPPITRRPELPTYPFQHQRYWLTPTERTTDVPSHDLEFWRAVENDDPGEVASLLNIVDDERIASLRPLLKDLADWRLGSKDRAATGDWHYQLTWRRLDREVPRLSGTWLVVTTPEQADMGRVSATSRAMTEQGAKVVTLVVADTVSREDLTRHVHDTVRSPALSTADSGANGRSSALAGVVSWLAVDRRSHPAFPHLPAGVIGNLKLAQALEGIDVPLWVLTQNAVVTDPDEPLDDPIHALSWGLHLVARQENPHGWGGLIDLAEHVGDDVGTHICQALGGGVDDQFAVRPRGLLRRRLSRSAVSRSSSYAWPSDGTVLITGGTGEVGKSLAKRIAHNGARHLLLLSRSGPEAPGASRLVDEVRALGAEIRIVACDIADRSALAGVLADIHPGQPLRTVIHMAGTFDDATLSDLTEERLENALRAKVDGALNLHELTKSRDLSEFILFSSTAVILGGKGFASYAAANAFLDSLAHHRRAQGLPAHSIAWGIWEGRDHTFPHHGLRRMRTQQALAALEEVLTEDRPAAVIASFDWGNFYPLYTAYRPCSLFDEIPEVARLRQNPAVSSGAGAGSGDALAVRLAELSPERQRHHLLRLVQTTVATVLGHSDSDGIPLEHSFKDLGLDSLTALELRKHLKQVTGLELPATLIYDYPTSQALAAYVHRELCPDESGKDAGPILSLLRQAISLGKPEQGADLLLTASRLRPSFDGLSAEARPLPSASLSQGPVRPALVCLSSGEFEYRKFARALEGIRDVSAIILPGFSSSPLPANVSVMAESVIKALPESLHGKPVVLVGASLTCLPVCATALALEQLDSPLAGVVLIDPPGNAANGRDDELSLLLRRLAGKEGPDVPSDERLTATAWYSELFRRWESAEIETPILLVQPGHARPPLRCPIASTEAPKVVTVPAGTDVLEEHSALIGLTVSNWLMDLARGTANETGRNIALG
ncbi:SDR family NAD(P)-dependent oxidoreductase [Sphaerisporangium sp. NBC_01403]|uniref:type I polyketide synthase n=1 Tax=Sphaerisporangium sp. NBC_01403 TaxID=2903599 RepID=UPI003248864D